MNEREEEEEAEHRTLVFGWRHGKNNRGIMSLSLCASAACNVTPS